MLLHASRARLRSASRKQGISEIECLKMKCFGNGFPKGTLSCTKTERSSRSNIRTCGDDRLYLFHTLVSMKPKKRLLLVLTFLSLLHWMAWGFLIIKRQSIKIAVQGRGQQYHMWTIVASRGTWDE